MKMKLKPGKKMALGVKQTSKLLHMIDSTREEELDCGAVIDNLDSYVEYSIKPAEKNQIIQLIEEHLDMCGDCAEEFQILLNALKFADK